MRATMEWQGDGINFAQKRKLFAQLCELSSMGIPSPAQGAKLYI